jgi:hypothetical protein
MSESRTAAPLTGATSVSTSSALEYVVRPGGKADLPMVADAWVLTLRALNRAAKRANKATFFRHHHRVVERILQQPDTQIRIAAPPDDDFTVYGFAVLQPGIVHMTYVKGLFRKIGMAKRLLADMKPNGLTYTQMTRDIYWIHEKYPGLVYDPFWDEDARQ